MNRDVAREVPRDVPSRKEDSRPHSVAACAQWTDLDLASFVVSLVYLRLHLPLSLRSAPNSFFTVAVQSINDATNATQESVLSEIQQSYVRSDNERRE